MEDILIQTENIKSKIFTLRGVQVMLDRDLEELYQTETRTLKQAVNRNKDRFPSNFIFVLDDTDILTLVSQFVIPSPQKLFLTFGVICNQSKILFEYFNPRITEY